MKDEANHERRYALISEMADGAATRLLDNLLDASKAAGAEPSDAAAIVSGALMAVVRFDIQHRTRPGAIIGARDVLVDLSPALHQAAVTLTTKPERADG